MKAEEMYAYDIEPFDGCEIQCPECKEWSNIENWKEYTVPCDICGDHDAIMCPECTELFDHVYSPRFEVR